MDAAIKDLESGVMFDNLFMTIEKRGCYHGRV